MGFFDYEHSRKYSNPKGMSLIFSLLLLICFVIYISAFLYVNIKKLQVATAYAATPTQIKTGEFGLSFGATLQNISTDSIEKQLSDASHLGFGWIRLDIEWKTVQPNQSGSFDWSQYDRVVQIANKHNLKVLALLAYAPEWARLKECHLSDKCAPANVDRYAAFAKAAAQHYDGKISTWEIWNEPNLETFWKPAPDPVAYGRLLRSSYAAIKSIQKTSTVLSGGVGVPDRLDKSIDGVDFLERLYQNNFKSDFDEVAYHPYSVPALPNTFESWSGWSKMASTNKSIRSVMEKYGDSKKQVWITEFGAPTNGPDKGVSVHDYRPNSGASHVDEVLQAEFAKQAIELNRHYSWTGPLFWYSYMDTSQDTSSSENFYGLLSADGSHKQAYDLFYQELHSR